MPVYGRLELTNILNNYFIVVMYNETFWKSEQNLRIL